MFTIRVSALLLLTTTIAVSYLFAQGQDLQADKSVVNNAGHGAFEELNDLNAKSPSRMDLKQKESIEEPVDGSISTAFQHHDEDVARLQNNLDFEESLNLDVEVLESDEIKKENIEIEERFRGNAIKMDTDTFVAENIEVHGGDDIHESHMILTVILLLIAIVSIALYAALVIWRSHLEQRYGMRELLVNEDDDYCQQNNMRRNVAGRYSVVQM